MSQPSPPMLQLSGITKRFGGALALDRADLRVERGSVHGLVGQNGAGKSTLIRILAGLHRPDGGTLTIDGKTHATLSPQIAAELGIHFIHQDRLLVPGFTVAEALFLGKEPRLGASPLLNRRAMAREALQILSRDFGLVLDPERLISDLTTAEKQIIQISRALMDRPRVLVFDEPTAALVRAEAETLFALIRRLSAEGITILYVSHYLGEIEALCDSVTILRNGEVAARLAMKDTSAADIARRMVARDLADLYPPRRPRRAGQAPEPVLELDRISRAGSYHDISLTLHRGEILGLTGLLGSGAKEVIRTLFGLIPPDSGRIRVKGQSLRRLTPPSAVARGLALLPEDRRRQGLALDLTLRENITMASLSRFARQGFMRPRAEAASARALIDSLQVRTSGEEALASSLSGGNQQKVSLAKWLCRQSEIYLLDEPSVGVDIAAKTEIYQQILRLTGEGAAVLILSSDLGEILGLCDRVHVFYRGRITATLNPETVTEDEVLALATGSHAEPLHAH